MFCRSCWANVPDGSAVCSRCGRDPRITGTPVAGPDDAPPSRGAPEAPSRPRWPQRALPWVNLGLVIVFIGGALGPTVVKWITRASGLEPGVVPDGVLAASGPAAAGRTDPPVPDGGPAPLPPGSASDGTPVREAYELYQTGRVEEACRRYAEVLARAPGDEIRQSLGACLARLGREAYRGGRFADAVGHYGRAVDAHPAARDHRIGLALAHAKAGELVRAQQVLQDAAGVFPDDAELLYVLADVMERQGRTAEAVETLRRLLTIQPAHARGRGLLAVLEREQRVEGDYWTQESPHFVVRYEGAGGIEVGRSVVDLLERAYESIGRDLGVFPVERVQVGIYVTRTFAELGGIPPEFAEHVLGFYDLRKVRLRLSASEAHSIALERLVRHEYAHHLIHLAAGGRATRWLHEGLAQVVEPRAAPRLVEFDVDRQHLTLSGLEGLFRTGGIGAAYQLSHVLAEHLVDRGGMSGMRTFLTRLGRGEALPQALQGAFGLGVEEIEARLLAAGGRG